MTAPVWHLLRHGTLLLLAAAAAVLCAVSAWRDAGRGPGHAGWPRSTRLLAPLQSFGRLSYEIYLTHMFVVWALAAGVARAVSLPAERWVRGALSRRAPAAMPVPTR